MSSGFSLCTNAPLPSSSNFTCPVGDSCLLLAGNSTVLCCPAGSTCSKILPVTCDLSEQDGSAHPDAVIKTTVFDVSMTTCGDGNCCPFGYTCDSSSECQLLLDQSQLPEGHDSDASSSSTSTSSAATRTTSPTTPTSTNPIQSKPSPASDSTFNQSLVIPAVIASVLAFILLVILGFWLWRRKQQATRKHEMTEQNRFEKVELDADHEIPRKQVFHEVSGLRSPVELPATPLPVRFLSSPIGATRYSITR